MPAHTLVLDLKNLIYVDSSGADSLMNLVRTCRKRGVRLVICGLDHQPLDIASRCGFTEAVPASDQFPTLARALAAAVP